MKRRRSADIWALVHSERAALADDLASLSEQQWATPSLCSELTVREAITSTTSPLLPVVAMLGETVVHGEDIRRPLGLRATTRSRRSPRWPSTTRAPTWWFRRRTESTGCGSWRPTAPFATDSGLLVTGTTLDLVMAMVGRVAYFDHLEGDGVATLRDRS